MEKALYINPIIGTVLLVTSLILLISYSFQAICKSNETSKNDSGKKGGIVLNKLFLLRTFMLALASGLIIWLQWSVWNNTIINQLVVFLLMIKLVTGMVSETAKGIETVYFEVNQKNSKNLSNKGKVWLLYICYGTILLLTACQEWLSSIITRSVGVSGHKDLVIIAIITIWYFLLSFHTLCVFGIVIEVMFSCFKKKKPERKNDLLTQKRISEKYDAAKPLLVCCDYISGKKRRIIRFMLYVLLMPLCFFIGIALYVLFIILDIMETIIQYIIETWNRIKSLLRYVFKKAQGIGEKKYVWVCFRFSIMISVVIAVVQFYKYQILQESTLQIFVFAAETLIIPFIITEIARIKEVFGDTPSVFDENNSIE